MSVSSGASATLSLKIPEPPKLLEWFEILSMRSFLEVSFRFYRGRSLDLRPFWVSKSILGIGRFFAISQGRSGFPRSIDSPIIDQRPPFIHKLASALASDAV